MDKQTPRYKQEVAADAALMQRPPPTICQIKEHGKVVVRKDVSVEAKQDPEVTRGVRL